MHKWKCIRSFDNFDGFYREFICDRCQSKVSTKHDMPDPGPNWSVVIQTLTGDPVFPLGWRQVTCEEKVIIETLDA